MANEENCEKFIDAVQQFPLLYEPTDANYKNMDKRNDTWEIVAEMTNIENGLKVKEKWQHLRDYYKKKLLQEKTITGQAAANNKRWCYMEQMDFLRDSLTFAETQSNISMTEIDSDSNADEPSSISSRKSGKRKVENIISEYLENKLKKQPNKSNEMDEVDCLFQYIAKVVKSLSKINQL